MPDPAPGPGPGPIPVPENWVKITNLAPGECIPLEFDVTVDYSTANAASVGLACTGFVAPNQQVGHGANTLHFHVVHNKADPVGHIVTAALTTGGPPIASDSVSPIGIGNPCPIIINTDGVWRGLPVADPSGPVSGTFAAKVGNRVFVQVYQPGAGVKGVYQPPVLVFAGQAEVALKDGVWKHGPIPAAKRGYHLRAILTQNGEVKSIVRAICK